MKIKQTAWKRIGIAVLVGIATIFVVLVVTGVVSGGVLGYLGNARTQGADKAVVAHLAVLNSASLLYQDAKGRYIGFCHDSVTLETLKSASMESTSGKSDADFVCNENSDNWVASVPLASNGYSCIDALHVNPVIIADRLDAGAFVCPPATTVSDQKTRESYLR